eukprot:5698959-Pyramimonas_sp.AAC.1
MLPWWPSRTSRACSSARRWRADARRRRCLLCHAGEGDRSLAGVVPTRAPAAVGPRAARWAPGSSPRLPFLPPTVAGALERMQYGKVLAC